MHKKQDNPQKHYFVIHLKVLIEGDSLGQAITLAAEAKQEVEEKGSEYGAPKCYITQPTA